MFKKPKTSTSVSCKGNHHTNIWGCLKKTKRIYHPIFVAYTVKGRGNSLAWQRRQNLRAQVLRRALILEVKQVYSLFLMQGLNAHNWIWGKMGLLSLVYMENFCFFNSPGTMAWPPLTGFSSVSAEIVMSKIFVLIKQYFNFNIKLFKTWLHRSVWKSLSEAS